SKDVIHSFWVPEMEQKQDAVPGQLNTLVITPNRLGTYPVICTELCGLGHSAMRSTAIVMDTADFDKWYASTTPKKAAPIPPGGEPKAAVTPSLSRGCRGCHTFKPIPQATGTVGPSLDTLKEEAQKAGQPLNDFIESSIVDPDKYIEPSYKAGV